MWVFCGFWNTHFFWTFELSNLLPLKKCKTNAYFTKNVFPHNSSCEPFISQSVYHVLTEPIFHVWYKYDRGGSVQSSYKLMGFSLILFFARWDPNSSWNLRKFIDPQTQTVEDLWNIQNGHFKHRASFSLTTLIGKFEPEVSIQQMTITVSLGTQQSPPLNVPVKTVASPILLEPFSSCKTIKICLKGVIPIASIYVIIVVINGWAIFIISKALFSMK